VFVFYNLQVFYV